MLLEPHTFLPAKLNPISAEIGATGARHLVTGIIILPNGDSPMHIASNVVEADQPGLLRMMAAVLNKRADALEQKKPGLIFPGRPLLG